ncbi:hypothetical protein AZSI13_10990 [Azospira sp. I13]|uniref:DUF302 domain-containing protein n=1 Tax=Azospira sp. I13 TaxID=1765050 RepID=UPI000D47A55A|nr:DUF302 domain-containing protein [Azospira sp. I13]GBG01772.1 hypothetical protein AZSI13_10990 [Azospira sp. I13]
MTQNMTKLRQSARALLCAVGALGTLAAPPVLAQSSYAVPEKYTAPAPAKKQFTPNTVMDPITPEARKRFMQSGTAFNPLSVRDMVNLLAYKVEAKPGVSYDDVVASLKARANKLNFKFVGVNSIYKDVAALTGKPTPKVEVFNFCDAQLARDILDYSLEFVIFFPCRIAVVEDAAGKVWLVMLDWDVSWFDGSPNPNTLPDNVRQGAERIRKSLEEIIQAGANGDL